MNVIPNHHIQVGAETLAIRAGGDETRGELLAFDVRMPPGGGPPLMHRHAAAEVYRVQAGELVLYVEDEAGAVRRVVAVAGDVVAIPGGREHTVRNESDGEAEAYVVLAPGAAMERFVRAAGELAATAPPSPADVLELAERHGIELTRATPRSAV